MVLLLLFLLCIEDLGFIGADTDRKHRMGGEFFCYVFSFFCIFSSWSPGLLVPRSTGLPWKMLHSLFNTHRIWSTFVFFLKKNSILIPSISS